MGLGGGCLTSPGSKEWCLQSVRDHSEDGRAAVCVEELLYAGRETRLLEMGERGHN